MHPISRISRVVLVVMDGLRAEAVRRLELSTLNHLARNGAWTFSAQTIRPSVTAAAMTSLFTGVPPERHGISGPGFGIPRDVHRLRPLTQLLARARLPSSILLAQIPPHYRWLSRRLGSLAGVQTMRFQGETSDEILDLAMKDVASMEEGLIFMHWPDADRAGHIHGWESTAYERKARAMDASLERLVEGLDLYRREDTLLVVCSDHGGGGVCPTDHNSDHPDDTTIPIVLAGAGIRRTHLGPEVTLLDLPATILWALGVEIPSSYVGRPLQEAFFREAWAA